MATTAPPDLLRKDDAAGRCLLLPTPEAVVLPMELYGESSLAESDMEEVEL